MGKFKVGDRVRVKDGYGTAFLQEGGEYEILRYSADGPVVAVHDAFGSRCEFDYTDEYFELLPVAEQPAAWQPKVGDRVRVTHGHGWNGEGVVELVADDWDNTNVRLDDGRVGGFSRCDIQPLPVAADAQPAAWVPAVGDKVRWRGVFNASMYTVGKVYEIHRERGDTLYVTDDSDDLNHSWDAESILDHFDLVSRPLTIEAGKFYRTRDGQKVGPMETYDLPDVDLLAAKIDGNPKLFNRDGSHHFKNHDYDLIAEWVDGPTAKATVAAQVDTIAEEYGPVVAASNDNAKPKFKVGDRVRWKEDSATVITLHPVSCLIEVDDPDFYGHDGDDELTSGRGWFVEYDELELLVPAPTVAPQQSASTAGFTIPLVDDEPADDHTLAVTLTLEADDLHEELDGIIAKLKKIRKLQRQVGLAA